LRAPEQLLGEAVRKLVHNPSKDWIAGFDAGYEAAIKAIAEMSKVQQRAMKLSKEARHALSDVGKTLAYLESEVGDFHWPLCHKSIIGDDIQKAGGG